MTDLSPLRDFVVSFTRLLDAAQGDEARLLKDGAPLLARLTARDDWLPDDFARPHERFYQQHLLHGDPLERLSVVSFVWGPGQATPIHDHTVWGLVSVLRGKERQVRYERSADGALRAGKPQLLLPGEVEAVSPAIGDIHQIDNAHDGVSISIHVYGGNIGRIKRSIFDPATGARKAFVSGYVNNRLPNLWSLPDGSLPHA